MMIRLLLVIFTLPLFARTVEGINFAETYSLGEKTLKLNGVGLREATIFSVDVYAAGLYLEKLEKDSQTIINSTQDMTVYMHFVRSVDKEKMANAFSKAIKNNMEEQEFEQVKERVALLGTHMISTEPGTKILFEIKGEQTSISVNGQKKGEFQGRDFARAILKCWLGPNPPNKGLKLGMLGL